MSSESLPSVSFGTDGIRGIAGQPPLDALTLTRIGRALGLWANSVRAAGTTDRSYAVIGMDTRQSSPFIAAQITGGLRLAGLDALLIGTTTTPELAHAVVHAQGHPLGIMITASHNPYDQNGIKVFDFDGYKLADAAEAAVEALIAVDSTTHVETPAPLLVINEVLHDAIHVDYAHALLGGMPEKFLAELVVVLDCAQGAAHEIAEAAFQLAGALAFVINDEPNGLNINNKAGSEYVRRDRSALLGAITEYGADLGIAFDGDADRVVFVTPDGLLIDGDTALGLLAVQMKAANRLPGDTVIVTDMSNSGLEDYLREHGIGLERTKVGDRYVMARMKDGGFTLGGEQAGHVIILDGKRTAGDGIYAGLQIAALVADHKRTDGQTLRDLATAIPRYPQVIASAHLDRQIALDTVAGLAELRAETLLVFGGQGRVNVRFSGTEPNLLRAMVEGGAANTLAEVAERARALCGVIAAATGSLNPRIDLVDCMTGAPLA
jgi:phosphoglucosamine mutase